MNLSTGRDFEIIRIFEIIAFSRRVDESEIHWMTNYFFDVGLITLYKIAFIKKAQTCIFAREARIMFIGFDVEKFFIEAFCKIGFQVIKTLGARDEV
jgi:hypothetical protein